MNEDSSLFLTNPEDESLIASLRVKDWQAFHGQNKVKESLLIAIQAAKERKESLDHVLLYGPPGLGKTTLSHLIAKSMDATIIVTSGTALAKSSDLAAMLTGLSDLSMIFIDEIHRLPKPVEELLYTAMEDFALDIILGKGPSARTVRVDLPPFTLIGATTRFGSLSGPFRDRFGLIHRVEHYDTNNLVEILQQAAPILGIKLDLKSAKNLAERSRGTPRVALKLLKRIRDFSQVKYAGLITPQIVSEALKLHAVDELGLTQMDRHFLHTIIDKHQGGPVGLSTIAATLNEDPITIEEVIEPFLLQIGFIKKTPQGRVIHNKAYNHLGLEPLA